MSVMSNQDAADVLADMRKQRWFWSRRTALDMAIAALTAPVRKLWADARVERADGSYVIRGSNHQPVVLSELAVENLLALRQNPDITNAEAGTLLIDLFLPSLEEYRNLVIDECVRALMDGHCTAAQLQTLTQLKRPTRGA